MPLVGFAGTVGETVSGLPFTLVDYLDLVERAADSDVQARHYRGGCAADPGRPRIAHAHGAVTDAFFDPLPDDELDAWGS